MSYYDSESNLNTLEDVFSEKAVRMGFIRKVYGILMVQLTITVSFISIFVYVEDVKIYTQNNPWMFIVAFILMFVMMVTLVCCSTVRRMHPWNFVCLLLFTLAKSFVLGTASGFLKDKDGVMIAVGICAVVCLGLTLFAFQTKIDFTVMGGFLLVALLILICFGFICIFIPGKVLELVYASFGALVFSLYIVYDTQLLIGGKHKYTISPEEYIFAALNLYLDIINLLMYIMRIVISARN